MHKIRYHKTLNPKIWSVDGSLNPNVRQSIITIATDFIDYMHSIGFEVSNKDILDIVIHGSNANYFYDKKSDIDIYILMDLDAIQEKYKELNFFTIYMSLFHTWCRQHNLRICGLGIDLCLKNVNKPLFADVGWCWGSAYSVIHNKWINELVCLDKKTFRKYQRIARKRAREILRQARKVIAYNGRLDEFVRQQYKLHTVTAMENHLQPLVPETMAQKMVRHSGLFWRFMTTTAQRRAVEQFGVD